MEKPQLTMTVSVQQKVELPGYRNEATAFLSLSGITMETTEAEIDEMIERGSLPYKKLATAIRAEVAKIKQQGGV